jgi:hypothetical protein
MKNEEEERAPITRLPHGTLAHVFSYGTAPKQLGRLALVSKKFQSISEGNALWEPFGVKSKKDFAEFMNSSAINIRNMVEETHEIGIAYGSGSYFTELTSKMKGETFNECIMQIKLPTGQHTVIRFCDLPEITVLGGPQKIYGLTKLPGNTRNIHDIETVHVDEAKCGSILSDRGMVIWDMLGKDSKFFEIRHGALADMIVFQEHSL